MRSKIPQHVDIVLEESEVNARGIVVIQLAQSSFAEQLRDLPDRTGKQEGVIHHDPQVFLDGNIDQLLALRHVAGERLLDKHMFAVFQSSLGQFVVGPYRSNDGNGVDVG